MMDEDEFLAKLLVVSKSKWMPKTRTRMLVSQFRRERDLRERLKAEEREPYPPWQPPEGIDPRRST